MDHTAQARKIALRFLQADLYDEPYWRGIQEFKNKYDVEFLDNIVSSMETLFQRAGCTHVKKVGTDLTFDVVYKTPYTFQLAVDWDSVPEKGVTGWVTVSVYWTCQGKSERINEKYICKQGYSARDVAASVVQTTGYFVDAYNSTQKGAPTADFKWPNPNY